MRQESVADYLRQLESLRADGIRVGVAPHSVRACPRDWLEELGRYAESERLPLHVHASEQPREVEECLAEHGCRPIELLARTGCLGPHTTVVHATHADGAELDLLAEATRRVRLPDDRSRPRRRLPAGSSDRPPADRALHRQRLERADRPVRGAARARGHRPPPDRPARNLRGGAAALFGADEGGRSLGLESWPEIEIDLGHESLRGVEKRTCSTRSSPVAAPTSSAPAERDVVDPDCAVQARRLDRDPREDGPGGCARAHGHASPALPDREPHAHRRPPDPPKIAVEPADCEPQIACDVLSPDPCRCGGALPRSRRAVDGGNGENTGTGRRPARCETRRRPAGSCDRGVPCNLQVAQRQHGPLRRKNRSVRGSRRLLEAPVEARVTRAGEQPPQGCGGVLLRPIGPEEPEVVFRLLRRDIRRTGSRPPRSRPGSRSRDPAARAGAPLRSRAGDSGSGRPPEQSASAPRRRIPRLWSTSGSRAPDPDRGRRAPPCATAGRRPRARSPPPVK